MHRTYCCGRREGVPKDGRQASSGKAAARRTEPTDSTAVEKEERALEGLGLKNRAWFVGYSACTTSGTCKFFEGLSIGLKDDRSR